MPSLVSRTNSGNKSGGTKNFHSQISVTVKGHRFEHDNSPTWPNCVDEQEDAEHILTCCPRFRWPGEMSLGPNRDAKELVKFKVT